MLGALISTQTNPLAACSLETHKHTFKTKALDLAEIWSHLSRGDAVSSDSDDILLALVRCRIKGQSSLPRENPNFTLLRCEFPRQDIRHRAVERYTKSTGGRDWLQST